MTRAGLADLSIPRVDAPRIRTAGRVEREAAG
jgi:hypothetical protein